MISLGYIPSIYSATDFIQGNFNVTLPNNYNLFFPLGVRDQKDVPKCVSVSVTDMVLWHLNNKNIKSNFLDNYFFFNRENKSIAGMSPKEAFHILSVKGVPTKNKFYKMSIFGRINSIASVKLSIVNNGPVLVALPVYSFDNKFWENRGCLLGGHAVLFTGFNENSFILRNSWGVSYGIDGYFEFPFKDFKSIYECWTLID